MRLLWSQRSINELKQLRDYIAQDSPHYARQFIERLLKHIDNLSEFPLMGRVVPESKQNDIREIIHQNYRVIYRVHGQIEIITVLHSSRDLAGQQDKPWEEI